MNDSNPHHPKPFQPEPDLPENGPTLDLNLDEFEGMEDLQALADEVAESTSPDDETGAQGTDPGLAVARQRVEELRKAGEAQADKHHRLLADFANYRNRVGRDIALAVGLAERKLLMEFLPVVDSFERCLSSNYANVEDFQNGIALIHKQFLDALRKAGVEEVELKVGDPFNANHSEALTTTSQPTLADGAVAAIYERGFTHKDQLLRAARVIVNHNPQPEADAPQS